MDTLYLTTLCYAGLLSLLGLALTLRHRASGVPDFSIVAYMGLGVFVTGYTVLSGFNLYVGPVFAFIVGCVAGFGHYKGVMAVMERRGDSAVMRALSTIGVQILVSSLLGVIVYCFVEIFGVSSFFFHYLQSYDFILFDLHGIFFVIPIVCISVYVAFHQWLKRSAFSRKLTASEENPDLAMVQGVDPWRVKTLVWALSGGLACLAGSLFPPFLHLYPDSPSLLPPILAVGVLGGFNSLAASVLAAFLIGVTEIQGILWLQINFGTWMGEYRPMISIAVIYFTMLLIPRGLIDIKKPVLGAVNYLRADWRRAVKILAVVLVVVGFVALTANSATNRIEEERLGWMNVANRVGRAGATIYPDTPTANLPRELYFENVYPPSVIIPVSSVKDFAMVIGNRDATIVYLHDGSLYIIPDSSIGYSYDPRNDNFGH